VFENVVLRKIFGSKKDKVTREWGSLHNDKLHYLCSSTNKTPRHQTKTKEMGGTCGTYGGEEM
jgi:hypothetical protein